MKKTKRDYFRLVLESITMLMGTCAGLFLLVFVFVTDKYDSLPFPFEYDEAMILPLAKVFCICAYSFIIMTITLLNMKDEVA